jgi:phospholipid/cholesterol/gamma-HCH transport system substrate-binding protein
MVKEQLYTNLDQTSKDLDELLKDLKSNLKRYFHFSGFVKNNA